MIDVLWFLQIYIIFKEVIMWVYEMSWVKTIPQWFVNPLHSTGYSHIWQDSGSHYYLSYRYVLKEHNKLS